MQRTARRSERGFSLVEVIVATAIFVVVLVAALMLYDRSTNTFRRGIEAADTQQNTRVSFDKLLTDLRMAGFDYDRDGFPSAAAGTVWTASRVYAVGDIVVPVVVNGFNYRATIGGTSGGSEPTWPTTIGDLRVDGGVTWETIAGTSQAQQPDEQIEYVGPSAITIRANFDYNITPNQGREPALESASFPVVTTGNHEIVTYALRSADASKNIQSVQFFADVNASGAPSRTAYPGGSSERQITIPNVDLTNANPPYTLHRFTLAEDGSVVSSPVAENIRSLNFFYFQDTQGLTPLEDLSTTPVAFPQGSATLGGSGQYNPASPATLIPWRTMRSRVRSVRVELVGMSSQPDPAYTDTDPIVATRNFRKYRLETLIVPRNIGKRGLREFDTMPPGAPVLQSACFGHCSIAKLTWQAPSTGGAVEQYAILYDTDLVGGFASSFIVSATTFAYVVLPDPAATYYFAVQALNGYGASPESNVLSGIPLNRTKPDAIDDITVNTTASGIQLSWQKPVTNDVGGLTCVPSGSPSEEIPAQENIRYRIYRSIGDDMFTADSTTRIWDENSTGGNLAYNPGSGTVTFTDSTAANCVDYYYRIEALDRCGDDSSLNASGFTGVSDIFPAAGSPGTFARNNPSTPPQPMAPSTLQVLLPASNCDAFNCEIYLEWPRVTLDISSNPVAVDEYIIRRRRLLAGVYVVEPPDDVPSSGHSATSGPTISVRQDVPAPVAGVFDMYEYTVFATNCSTWSDPSLTVRFPCAWSGGSPVITNQPVVGVSGALEGNGDAGSPFLVFGSPSFSISGITSTVNVTAFVYLGGTQIEGPLTRTGPGALPISTDPIDDGTIYSLSLQFVDSGGCSVNQTIYFVGSSSNCCLAIESITGAVASSAEVTVTFRNQCSANVAMNASGAVRMQWTDDRFPNPSVRLGGITYPREGGGTIAGTVATNTEGSVVSHSAPGGADVTIEAGTTYEIKFSFTRDLNVSTSPILDLCISYGSSPITVCNIINDGFGTTCP